MTDNPLRGTVGPENSIQIPYSPAPRPTSRATSVVFAVLAAVWFIQFTVGLVFTARYALTNPFVDEWAFIPALFGERPAWQWIWELHNEHRFPLPRVIYLGLFLLTGDLRAGCVLSFLGISLLALGLMKLASAVRGRPHLTDAVFPLLLMHVGQGENLYMGYQMVFMLTALFAAGLLAVIIRLESGNHFHRGFQAVVLGWLSLGCGAAGLAYGVAAAIWVVILAIGGRLSARQRVILAVSALATPLYIIAYFQGYVRPGHHPPSAGFYESARVGLQAQAMAFGPAATGLWPAIGVVCLVFAIVVPVLLIVRVRIEPLRTTGMCLFLAAAGTVAFGIGWGRSGFLDDMGFAWRYGWLTAPAIWSAYFTGLMRGGRLANFGPKALLAFALAVVPVNSISGFLNAEYSVRKFEIAWEADVRAGLLPGELVEKHYPDHSPEFRKIMVRSLNQMRDRQFTYYGSLGREAP